MTCRDTVKPTTSTLKSQTQLHLKHGIKKTRSCLRDQFFQTDAEDFQRLQQFAHPSLPEPKMAKDCKLILIDPQTPQAMALEEGVGNFVFDYCPSSYPSPRRQ